MTAEIMSKILGYPITDEAWGVLRGEVWAALVRHNSEDVDAIIEAIYEDSGGDDLKADEEVFLSGLTLGAAWARGLLECMTKAVCTSSWPAGSPDCFAFKRGWCNLLFCANAVPFRSMGSIFSREDSEYFFIWKGGRDVRPSA